MANERLDGILEKYRNEPSVVILALQEIQETFGFLAPDALASTAGVLGVPFSRVYGVATFYTMFRFKPVGRKHVSVCRGTACHVKGADLILEHIERHLTLEEGDTTKDGEYSLQTVACIGCCALAPCITINQTVHGRLAPSKATRLLKAGAEEQE
ncbi:MAG: NADH-quinone oxidoreductase subunit NuoE [Vicinamibacterales bacterium]|nr:NADH-quinone oxidoreductase subunit NuoE [Vicinamibacterales bacterium]